MFTHFVCLILVHIIVIPTDIILLYQLEEAKTEEIRRTRHVLGTVHGKAEIESEAANTPQWRTKQSSITKEITLIKSSTASNRGSGLEVCSKAACIGSRKRRKPKAA